MRAIIFLVAVVLVSSLSVFSFAFDVDGDGKEGLVEAVHALQVVSGMAPVTSNIIFIEPVGTDPVANGTALLDRLAAITDASNTNPYVVKIEPGTYDLGNNGLEMQSYVDIEGSGQKTTLITSSHTAADAIDAFTILGANNAEIRLITIDNKGTANSATAIANNNTSPAITYVTATVSGGARRNTAVMNVNASPIITNVTINVSGGEDFNYGIFNSTSGSSEIKNVNITVTGGTQNCGIKNDNTTPIIKNVDIEVSNGGDVSYGVYNESSNPEMNNMKIGISDGSESYGIYNSDAYVRLDYGFYPVNTKNIQIDLNNVTSTGIYNDNSYPVIEGASISITDNGALVGVGIETTNGSYTRVTHSYIAANDAVITSNSVLLLTHIQVQGSVNGNCDAGSICRCLYVGLMSVAPTEYTHSCTY